MVSSTIKMFASHINSALREHMLYFFFGGTQVWIQGLAFAKLVLYHFSHASYSWKHAFDKAEIMQLKYQHTIISTELWELRLAGPQFPHLQSELVVLQRLSTSLVLCSFSLSQSSPLPFSCLHIHEHVHTDTKASSLCPGALVASKVAKQALDAPEWELLVLGPPLPSWEIQPFLS
jgi:hypothetical protein